MPAEGAYRFRVVSTKEGYNQAKDRTSFKAFLQIEEIYEGGEGHRVGDVCTTFWIISGPGGQFGKERALAFVMAAAGYESQQDYDEFDPDRRFVEACLGEENEYSQRGDTLAGRLVYCLVRRGKATADDNDYFREYEWAVVPEEEQDGNS